MNSFVQNQSLPNSLKPEEFTQKIVLNNGVELMGSGGETFEGGDLWLWLDENISYGRASELFENNPEATSRIVLEISKIETVECLNYTVLSAIQKRSDGKMSIRLNRPV